MDMLSRWFKNLTTTPFALRRYFPPTTLAAIDTAIAVSEQSHRAEIRCAVEASLSIGNLLNAVDSKARAIAVFSMLRMWDTAENNGVLLYMLLAEQKIEIIADRGFANSVASTEWMSICAELERSLAAGNYEAGTLVALDRISALARQHFPAANGDSNELPNRTVLL
jgi:uncharacterized membrane protein